MTTVEIQFLASRYHGTGWGRHVNEGVPEWPPSPYRLLRALYDVWKRKCPHLAENDVRDTFAALAAKLPKFRLPKAVAAHTRSYLSGNSFDLSDKSLVFDAFVSLPKMGSCAIEWEFTLGEQQRLVLCELLCGLNYLGRSESWVEARLDGQANRASFSCEPATRESASGDLVYLACPVAPTEYAGKRSWFDALTYSSSELVKGRLSSPPAMQSVPYVLQQDAVTTYMPTRAPCRDRGISAALLELHGAVLPSATDTIRVAERIRGRLMRQFEEAGKPIPPLIHGKDEHRRPLKDHSHLFILPQSNAEGRIDSVLLFSRRTGTQRYGLSFDAEEIRAIANVKWLRWFDSVRVTPAWMGKYDDLGFRPKVKTVVSTTPFITVRHWRKGRGSIEEFLKDEIRRECRNHQMPQPITIEPLEFAGRFPPIKFRRSREDDAPRPGYSFRLYFEETVAAPFALGYACHFGLGQFNAAVAGDR